MSVLKDFGAFARIGLEEEQVRERQVHGEDVDLRSARRSRIADQRLEEVDLGLSGRLREGHENLGGGAGQFADEVFDDGFSAGVAALVAEAVEDAACGVALLFVDGAVGDQNVLDPLNVRAEFGRGAGRGLPVSGRRAVGEDFFEGGMMHSGFAQDGAFGDAEFEYAVTNVGPLVHVCVHLRAP